MEFLVVLIALGCVYLFAAGIVGLGLYAYIMLVPTRDWTGLRRVAHGVRRYCFGVLRALAGRV